MLQTFVSISQSYEFMCTLNGPYVLDVYKPANSAPVLVYLQKPDVWEETFAFLDIRNEGLFVSLPPPSGAKKLRFIVFFP